MSGIHPVLQRLSLFFFIVTVLFHTSCHGDVGTAAQYSPPYLPTVCYGNDPSQFPSSNLFGAAGEGIWDNGASCGRQYLVRCISATQARTCVPDQTIQIKIVDYAPTQSSSTNTTTMLLSQTAFGTIANSSALFINIEFQQGKSVLMNGKSVKLRKFLTCFLALEDSISTTDRVLT